MASLRVAKISLRIERILTNLQEETELHADHANFPMKVWHAKELLEYVSQLEGELNFYETRGLWSAIDVASSEINKLEQRQSNSADPSKNEKEDNDD
ncbi:hypothetical protein [Aureibacillus halotolerans]|uniref:Uncharacterized protein n=1 Tax=Aureibacillus halotolerans TaxID=1508390 RepID=A0A4R6TQM1_9BACI|nr:hypothetical protein [Aureibacillus halotolerans]TDQ35241.1 hypothetical protein EV213_12228 [Aureibacillus halotolerans]